MGISATKRKHWRGFSLSDQDRIVRMAWEDRTSFDNIFLQFKLTPNEVEQFMRTQLDARAYKRWRRRATERGHLKQGKLRPIPVNRFKCTRQSVDGLTKGWK